MRKTKELDRIYNRSYYASHSEEHKISQAKYDSKHPRIHIPDSSQGYRLMYLYKWTVEQYNEQLSKQGNQCALCSAVQGTHKRRMAVDHDHTCCKGQRACEKCRRGILCANCNRKVGFLESILEEALVFPKAGTIKTLLYPETWTARALQYLKKYEGLR